MHASNCELKEKSDGRRAYIEDSWITIFKIVKIYEFNQILKFVKIR